jgi:hypothetical protein
MGVLRKGRLGAPPSFSQSEKSNIERVCKWAKDHSDKLDMSYLLAKDNSECLMGYPQGKWPDPLVVRVTGREDFQ